MEGFFMPENWARHAYDTLSKRGVMARQRPDCIGETMQTSRKTLGPATDQGNAVQLLTTGEVAVWLHMAPKTLRNWRSAGIGPTALKLRGAVRYDRAVVAAWIRDEASKAAT
jgi:hypothetical protein